MTALAMLLHSFWGGFGMACYEQSNVPSKAELPYITYNTLASSYGSETQDAAIVWMKKQDGVDVYKLLSAKLDEVLEAIPEAGISLSVDGGGIVISRGTGTVLSYYLDPTDSTAIGGRIGYSITHYIV